MLYTCNACSVVEDLQYSDICQCLKENNGFTMKNLKKYDKSGDISRVQGEVVVRAVLKPYKSNGFIIIFSQMCSSVLLPFGISTVKNTPTILPDILTNYRTCRYTMAEYNE